MNLQHNLRVSQTLGVNASLLRAPLETILLFVFTLVAITNALLRPIKSSIESQGFSTSFMKTFDVNLAIWIAILIGSKLLMPVASVAQQNKISATTGLLNHTVLVAVLLLLLPPSSTLSWVSLAIFCAYYSVQYDQSSPQRAGLLILLFVALRDPLSQLVLTLLATPLLQFDAWAAIAIANIFEEGFQRTGNLLSNPSGFTLAVMTGCSSYHNISYALLAWYALVRSQRYNWTTRVSVDALSLCLLLLLTNLVRLAVMAQSPDLYELMHHGIGCYLIDSIQVALTFIFVIRSLRHEQAKVVI